VRPSPWGVGVAHASIKGDSRIDPDGARFSPTAASEHHMRDLFLRFTTGAAIALSVALAGSTTADAQSVMKMCGDQWKAAKAAGTTNGETWPQFLAQCRAQQRAGGAASTAPTAAPAPAAPAPSFGPSPTAAGVKTASQCNQEYAANKAAIKASGQTKRAFVAACRAGNETIPQGAAVAPAPAPAPTQQGSLFPWSQPDAPAPAPAPAPANYNPAPAPATYNPAPAASGAGQFASDQQARARCPSDTVVWVNTRSRIYHFPGTRDYGNTKQGAYMCEADAKATGDRAAMNEKHP
jgi:hypothetical protein